MAIRFHCNRRQSLGAAKLIGRFTEGTTLGVLDAMTERATSPGERPFEPRTNFGVLRATQDFRGGNSAIGGMFNRSESQTRFVSSPYLHESAYVGALDFRAPPLPDQYEVSGSFDQSRVEGTPAVILSTQQDAVHNYQRPDANLPLDPNRHDAHRRRRGAQVRQDRGQHLLFETDYQRRSEGFEINDLGYLRRADQVSWNTWAGFL